MTTINLHMIDPTSAKNRQGRLKLARKMRGIKSAEVAAKLGVSPAAMTRWEDERVPEEQAGITVDKLFAICKIYRVNPDWVVTGTLPVEPAESEPQAQVAPLHLALHAKLRARALAPNQQANELLASIQALALTNFVEQEIDGAERELLTLYARAKSLAHLPGFEFMIIAMRAAMNSFLASNPVDVNQQANAVQARNQA